MVMQQDDKLIIANLLKKKRQRRQKRAALFSKVLQKCHLRIKSAATNEHTECDFAVPRLILGYPLYNVQDCKAYVIKHLHSNGFKVKSLEDNEDAHIIQISWAHYDK
jgi:hypothetical protein